MPQGADLEVEIVYAIYRGACVPSELQRAVDLLARYFNAPGVAFGDVDQSRLECQLGLGSGSVTPDELVRYAKHFACIDPVPAAFATLPVGTVTTSKRIIPESQIRRTFVNEYIRPLGATEAMASTLFSNQGRVSLISVLQGVHQADYEDDDIARLRRLTPHLSRALQIRRLFIQGQRRNEALETIINRHEAGMIGVSGDGAVLFVNRAARAMASACDGIALDRTGRLVLGDHLAARKLAALLAKVNEGGGLVRVARPSGMPSYVVLVSRLSLGDETAIANGRPGILLAIHDPSRNVVPVEQQIAQLLHIPLGAAKVVHALLTGIDLKDYADASGLSMNTVRFHLKKAFAGAGARSQAELVRLALSAVHALGRHLPNGA